MDSYNFSQIKINEIARLTGTSTALISRHFKNQNDNKVTRVNQRVIGITPEAAQEYLSQSKLSYFYSPSITLFANLCGGVGKTSGGNRFPHTWITGQQHDATPALHILQTCKGFFKHTGFNGISGLDFFIKGIMFKAIPGQQIFHFLTLPLA